jgi:protein-tyrosine phosphatase
MIDYHSHILPGLDDGASDMDEAVDMCRVLAVAGFTAACCTPHRIRGCYDADNDAVGRSKRELQKRLDGLGIRLRLLTGSEYYLDEFLLSGLDNCIPLFETPYVLVELSNHMSEEFVRESCYRMRSRGCIPVIAHPERCGLLDLLRPDKKGLMERFMINGSRVINSKFKIQNSELNQNPNIDCGTFTASTDSLLEYLVAIGCQFQGNVGSFAGIYGEKVRRRAVIYLREGLYCRLGSDAHSQKGFADWLDRGLREIEWDIGTEGVADLFKGVPFNRRLNEPLAAERQRLGVRG